MYTELIPSAIKTIRLHLFTKDIQTLKHSFLARRSNSSSVSQHNLCFVVFSELTNAATATNQLVCSPVVTFTITRHNLYTYAIDVIALLLVNDHESTR